MTERIIGPGGSRRRKRWLLVPLALVVVATTVFAIGASGASLPGSLFEIDDPGGTTGANLVVDTAGNLDWETVDQLQREDRPTGATDDSYEGSAKEDTVCPDEVTGQIPNNKSDLSFFGGYHEPSGVVGDPGFLHVFWSRVQDPSGTTNMDFEFNKGSTPCAVGPNVQRTVGDVLIQFDVDRGGAEAHLSRRTWTGTEWGPATALGTTEAIGSINQVDIPAADADGLGDLDARTFGEASFDLSASFDPTGCAVFGSAMLKSRSSDSFQSQLKDFIRPISLNINTCGQVIIRKVTDPAGATVSFNYSKTFATSPVTANTFSLTGAAPNDVRTFTGALPGAGSVTEDLATLPGAWQFVGLDCSASVGVVVTVVGETASWTLDAPTDVVDCTYTNRLRQGAIIVTKTRKHAADGPGPHPHAGVTFSVDGTTKTGATGTDGTVCFDGLTWSGTGTSYNVTETLPGGYSADGALTKAVLVDHNATCAGGGGNTVSFGNTPLTDVTLSVDSAVDGGTATTFTCDNGASGSTGTNGDVTNAVVANDTEPATIICTIVVDP